MHATHARTQTHKHAHTTRGNTHASTHACMYRHRQAITLLGALDGLLGLFDGDEPEGLSAVGFFGLLGYARSKQ